MQLSDLVKPIDQMTDEELRERLRDIRHNRTVIRPASKKIKVKAAKKKEKVVVSKAAKKVDNILSGLTPEQIKQLLLDLGEG